MGSTEAFRGLSERAHVDEMEIEDNQRPDLIAVIEHQLEHRQRLNDGSAPVIDLHDGRTGHIVQAGKSARL
jgi:hypothetical protein